MASLNKVMLIGKLTRDPELRVTPKGSAICQFGLAINREFKDEAGNKREETTFVDVEAWNKTGEILAKYCVKGRPLFVEGRLKLDQFTDKTTGQKRSKMKVVVENFQFLPGSKGDGQSAEQQGQHDAPSANTTGSTGRGPTNSPTAPDAPDEDIPFTPITY